MNQTLQWIIIILFLLAFLSLLAFLYSVSGWLLYGTPLRGFLFLSFILSAGMGSLLLSLWDKYYG